MTPGARPILLAVLLTAVLTGTLLAIAPVRDVLAAIVGGDLVATRERLDALGAWAALVLLALALLHVVVPFPAELPSAAAGFAFGFWIGLPLMLGAWLVSGLAAYGLAQAAGRPLLRRWMRADRLATAERVVARGGVTGLLAVRLIPVLPFTLVSAVAGVTRVPLVRFSWTTVVGFIPITGASVLVGSRLRSPDFSDPLLWAPILVALALVALLGEIRRRSGRHEAPGRI